LYKSFSFYILPDTLISKRYFCFFHLQYSATSVLATNACFHIRLDMVG
jgi:hypothetical protein